MTCVAAAARMRSRSSGVATRQTVSPRSFWKRMKDSPGRPTNSGSPPACARAGPATAPAATKTSAMRHEARLIVLRKTPTPGYEGAAGAPRCFGRAARAGGPRLRIASVYGRRKLRAVLVKYRVDRAGTFTVPGRAGKRRNLDAGRPPSVASLGTPAGAKG